MVVACCTRGLDGFDEMSVEVGVSVVLAVARDIEIVEGELGVVGLVVVVDMVLCSFLSVLVLSAIFQVIGVQSFERYCGRLSC